MENLLLFLIFVYVGLIVIGVIRSFWMRRQAKEAVRRELARENKVLTRFKRANVFRDYGSPGAAFHSALTVKDYSAFWRSPDGSESASWFEAVFVPVLGVLRHVRRAEGEKPNLHSIRTHLRRGP